MSKPNEYPARCHQWSPYGRLCPTKGRLLQPGEGIWEGPSRNSQWAKERGGIVLCQDCHERLVKRMGPSKKERRLTVFQGGGCSGK